MLDWLFIEENNNSYKIKIPKVNTATVKYGLDAAHYNIDYIINNYPPPYTLCLSGGVDSQGMLYAWHTSGKPFNTMSVKYNNDLNDHDLQTLVDFSTQHNIKINYVDFDLLKFYESDYLEYVHTYRCSSPHFCAYMKFSEMVEQGTVLFSGTPTHLAFKTLFGKNELSLYRYGTISKRSIVPYFFLETKEIAWSFKTAGSYEANGYANREKIERYKNNGYPVIGQKKKITGFEKVKDYYDIHYKHLVTPRDKLQGLNYSTRVYDILLRNKYESIYEDKYNQVMINE